MAATASVDGIIEYDQFSQTKLAVGVVTECKAHENADKLLVLTLDIGTDKPRTVCAGLKAHYKPEELIGKRLILVLNLAPRVMRSVPSEGMILAATDKATGTVHVITVDGLAVAAGSEVK